MVLTDTADKIKSMEIRGAGRIARAAVHALQDHASRLDSPDLPTFRKELEAGAAELRATRPTAVSLPNAIHKVMSSMQGAVSLEEARTRFLSRCTEFIQSSEHAVQRIGELGSRHIRDGDIILTHCNSAAALECIMQAHRFGTQFEVFATEVRPRNQGLVTLRTLNDAGIRTSYIVDSAVRYFMKEIDLVIVGADAVTVNGAVINKIGTSQIALAAQEARTTFMVAAETYKFAPRTILGEYIEIEERTPDEVLPALLRESLHMVNVRNPAFDVTPADYIDLIVTEEGAIPPQMAYIIIRDYLGWGIGEFQNEPGISGHTRD